MVSCSIRRFSILFYVIALVSISRAAKQKIYYGEADLIHQLLNYTSQWTYVQENADGFSVSFGQLIVNLSPADLLGFFKLFKNKFIYYETDADPHHQALDTDKAEIVIFHNGGWNITYTSQNFGWTVERDEILGYYNLLALDLTRMHNIERGLINPMEFPQMDHWVTGKLIINKCVKVVIQLCNMHIVLTDQQQ
jgi:hypothetical protein